MKRAFVIFTVIIVCSLASCGGGHSTVPIYSPTGKTDTSPETSNAEPDFARTDRGREIFRQRCMACHGLGGGSRIKNASDLQYSRLDSLGITQVIRDGRAQMPMFRDVLNDSDIGHLAVYVKSLRK